MDDSKLVFDFQRFLGHIRYYLPIGHLRNIFRMLISECSGFNAILRAAYRWPLR